MKVELLCLDSVNKHQPFLRLSQRFESVYTLQGKKSDNTTHTSQEGTTSGYSSQRDQRVGPGSTSP
jgi:hypothetical protein